MSPSVGNFVHDLVEMAKAMETLPVVEAERNRLVQDNHSLADVVAAREATILRLKDEIEALQSKVREAEVSRDDAEMRFLEADDKLIHFRRLVNGFATDATTLMKAQEPEPVAVPEPQVTEPVQEQVQAEGQSEASPTPNTTGTEEGGYHEVPLSMPAAQAPGVDPNPTTIPEHTASISETVGEGGASDTVQSEPYDPTIEPAKYMVGTNVIRSEWWSWYNRQPDDFKQNYRF